MILTTWWQIFLVATAGGLVGEFVTLYNESRNDPTAPIKRKRDARYWVFSLLMALAGGGVALGYGYKEIQFFGALYLGASAPVVLKTGFSSFAPTAKPTID